MSIFFEKEVSSGTVQLSEEESRHCSQVLRHQVGDPIVIFDGKGTKHYASLTFVGKKKCVAQVSKSESSPAKQFSFHLAIAPTKNMDRMEWMVEKLTELGADEITFLQTKHSERRQIRLDRLDKKTISAMKQSGNPFLPKINEMVSYHKFLEKNSQGKKLIAHVAENYAYMLDVIGPGDDVTILIGPEGDFSNEEVDAALNAGYEAVSLGKTTLRTETAGLKACCFVSMQNHC